MGRAAAAAAGEAEPVESFIEPASQTALADATAELPLLFPPRKEENSLFQFGNCFVPQHQAFLARAARTPSAPW
jgi:hypothetical protein